MIKPIAALSATALLFSCESSLTATVETDTLFVTDTFNFHHYSVDTLYKEYDHYLKDTVRVVFADQGRYLITNKYDRTDTVLDYTNTNIEGVEDTVEFSSPRWLDCTYWTPELKWSKIRFDKYEMKMRDEGWYYLIAQKQLFVQEIR
jgi:hypothetical protein